MGPARISVLADTMEIDIVRKKELLMEKKLRACRVNILPRVSVYSNDYNYNYIIFTIINIKMIFLSRPGDISPPAPHLPSPPR